MSNLSKEALRDYINEQNCASHDEVLSTMEEMFRDFIQEALDTGIDTQIGYERYDISKT